MASTVSSPPRNNWSISTRDRGKNLYLLAVVSINDLTGNLESIKSIATQEFAFKMNPQAMSLEEPSAVNIVPTQDGGLFVEHQGQIFKNIQISGTTGLRPNMGPKSTIPFIGIVNPFASPDQDPQTGLPKGESTGFDDFIELRNLFRFYWDLKENPLTSPYAVMVWQNGKEGEYYVVEPLVFRTSRGKLTFNYDIQLKTISRFELVRKNNTLDVISNRRSVLNFVARIGAIIKTIEKAVILAESLVDRTASIGFAAVNQVLIPMRNVTSELAGLAGSTRTPTLSRQVLHDIATGALNIKAAFDEIKNDDAYRSQGKLTQLSQQANAYKVIARSCFKLLKEFDLFSSKFSTNLSQKADSYNNPIGGVSVNGGSISDLRNTSAGSSVAVATVNGGEDIYMISQRLLGDRARYKELILLNNLSYPYISSVRSTGVLVHGDNIKFPVPGSSGSTAFSKKSNSTLTNDVFGRDFLLVKVDGVGSALYDIVVDKTTKDFATISGPDNLAQAITIKFNTEQGELPTHPNFGGLFPIGTKAKQKSLIQFNLNVRSTLLTDKRIEDVDSLDIASNGNVISVKSVVTAKGTNQALTVNNSIRA